jgi:hypothetical protein
MVQRSEGCSAGLSLADIVSPFEAFQKRAPDNDAHLLCGI